MMRAFWAPVTAAEFLSASAAKVALPLTSSKPSMPLAKSRVYSTSSSGAPCTCSLKVVMKPSAKQKKLSVVPLSFTDAMYSLVRVTTLLSSLTV